MPRLADLIKIVSQRTGHRRVYAEWVVQQYELIRLGGLDPSQPTPLRLQLLDLYVPLKGRQAQPDRGDPAEHMPVGGRLLGDQAIADRFGTLEPVLALLQRHAGLTVLGAPGTGKTTFLKYLALGCARGILAEATDRPGSVGTSARAADLGLGPRLPLLVPISEYAPKAARTPLADFLVRYLTRIRSLPVAMTALIEEALASGRLLLLLDGLDEGGSLHRQKAVVDGVKDWCYAWQPRGNKCVVTSRIEGYRDMRLEVSGLVECTLLDFDPDDIKAFTHAFELATRTTATEAEARRDREELLRSIDRNEGVRRLAVNPLLLTILALFTRAGISLPERRVELYDRCVDGLIKYWAVVRRIGQSGGRRRSAANSDRARAVLAPLALHIQESGGSRGLVARSVLRREVETVFRQLRVSRPETAAAQFIEDVVGDVGILAERAPGQFGFVHLTLQEYLAAVGLVASHRRPEAIAHAILERVSKAEWREVVLLAVAHLGVIEGDRDGASAVVDAVMADAVRGSGRGRVTALMGEAIVEGAAREGEATDCISPDGRARVVEALLKTMRDHAVDVRERAACGEALARVGDPRFHDANRWCLPNDVVCGFAGAANDDRLGFVEIPSGKVLMGSDTDKDPNARDDELPQHCVPLDVFWIGRWPVTVGQFLVFVTETGYKEAGTDWARGLRNHPVFDVSWHDARAYCEWLSAQFRGHPARLPEVLRGLVEAGWRVGLPSEAEWECAARGNTGRTYTWGNEPDRTNRSFRRPVIVDSAVGCFRAGATPGTGVEELCGGTFEWTQSQYKAYPYDPRDGREASEGRVPRVVRGGAFSYDAWDARAASRNGNDPSNRYYDLGFRVAVTPFTWDL